MINSGTRPSKHVQKNKKFEFGGTDPSSIPAFNIDPGIWFPDQDADGRFFECVGYTNADWLADTFRTKFLPGYSYGGARYIAGDGPEGIGGTSFHAGVQALVCIGGLSEALGGPSTLTEQEESDWNNWTSQQKKSASALVQNGVRNVLGQYDAFDSVILAAYQTGKGISVGSPWYEGFNNAPSGAATISMIDGNPNSWHNWAIKGKEINQTWGIPTEYAIAKWWGSVSEPYRYFDRATINKLLSFEGSGALTVDPNASRWLSILGIMAMRFPAILPMLPSLIKLKVNI